MSDHELWKQAELISGVKDRSELEHRVLTEFIQREAGRQLAALGGTMPNATAAPRRRVTW
ncbi:MAG: type II toxin-antitoxin system VapB family antitoxin [Sphingomonadales bacterium]|nr:type II toxin-antitoxin system VapB family antitoxin [Sphingomonadaceae bacterium]MBS3930267.1 type II toxin-antitoxin system VapB family antitoxin [Sphingomonadales bacterium]